MSAGNQNSSTLNLADKLKNLCYNNLRFLKEKLTDGHYAGRSFYGEMFTALAMTIFDYPAYKDKVLEILSWYDAIPKTDDNFHWEFNNFALLKLGETQPELQGWVQSPLVYRGTKCTNWTLLRLLGKLMEGRNIADEVSNAKLLIRNMQLENGLFLDEEYVASFQYHCFILALVYDFYRYTDEPVFLDAFLNGINFISSFTLNNGDTLYIGRGQEQIFGYGCLIYDYCIAFEVTKDIQYIDLAAKVFSFVERYGSEKSMLPLVLNKYERDSDLTLALTDRRHLGWYSYNNYYDYLPFCTFYILEAVNILEQSATVILNQGNEQRFSVKYYDKKFLRYSDEVWDIVLSVYKGATANALPFPFIVKDGNEMSSVCGGDDYVNVGYYQLETVPLPSGRYQHTFLHMIDSKQYFKKKARSIIRRNADYANVYLWEQGNLYIFYEESNEKFGIYGRGRDYDFKREIRIDYNKVWFKDVIRFNRNVRFSVFIPFRLFFSEIRQIRRSQYKIPNGILTMLRGGGIKPQDFLPKIYDGESRGIRY